MIKQHQVTAACPCLPIYDQPGRQPQFQWNASYGNRIEKPRELCFRQERRTFELELHFQLLY